jgi:hypothetical protein
MQRVALRNEEDPPLLGYWFRAMLALSIAEQDSGFGKMNTVDSVVTHHL